MPQEEIVHCLAGHSSNDIFNHNYKNFINIFGFCNLCTKENFFQEFGTWSSGNVEIDKVIQEDQISHHRNDGYRLQWMPYDDFRDIKHIADGGYGSVYSAILKNGVKLYWNFNKQDWEYRSDVKTVALKEINDSRHDISEFLKEVKNLIIANDLYFITKCIGISKNPSTQNYIIIMELQNYSLHKFLTKNFGNLRWSTKKYLIYTIAIGLLSLHQNNLVHRDLHSGNILISYLDSFSGASITDLGLCRLENDLILKSDNKSNNIYGSIPYIPPEVLRGNKFTQKGDIYSFGGIMYEIATGKQPFHDRAHDTYLIIDICNGIRPKIPDWIPEWYSDLMNQCWSGDPSERPTAKELYDVIRNLRDNCNKIDNIFQQFKVTDQNQEKESHPQSCYISRRINTLHGLYNSLEDIKSGKSQDPNLLKSNELTSSSISTYDIDSKESQECIDFEKEIQNQAKNDHFQL
ncbi:hypothetical protein Glove_311g32 [Diversispora epigaea]|uniref:Protein kinase domain-containing protein n=1 Tax=Diversispora epigaea TaxID=1348612 RepID=A0A397HRF0_9GLOM|nr:hypothetical protein Glove_311g32 [Diversispora epigaea]